MDVAMDTIKLLSDESCSEDEALNQGTTPLVERNIPLNPFELHTNGDDDDEREKEDRRGGNQYLYLASSMAAIGGITFGYDMGIVSGALLQLRHDMNLSCQQQEVLVSTMLVGALFGSLIGGFLLDWFGRRKTLIWNAALFIIGALMMTIAQGYHTLLIGRIVVGVAVAISGIGECIYVSEISPPGKRGQLVLLNETGICLGILLAYLINFIFIGVDGGWRYMFLLSAVPAIVQACGMYTLPASPRYLLMKGKDAEAFVTLQHLRCRLEVQEEWTDLKEGIQIENKQTLSFFYLCGSARNLRGRMLIAIGLVIFENLTGQTTVIYYAPTIFQMLGFPSKFSATLATVGLGITKLLASVIALFLVDVVGRRRLLLFGGILMAVVITVLGVVVQVLPSPDGQSYCKTDVSHAHIALISTNNITDNLDTRHIRSGGLLDKYSSDFLEKELYQTRDYLTERQRSKMERRRSQVIGNYGDLPQVIVSREKRIRLQTGGVAGAITDEDLYMVIARQKRKGNITDSFTHNTTSMPLIAKGVAVVSLMLYVFAFSLGYGPVVWLLLSEFFPADVRGRASSLANSLNWMINIIINLTFLDLLDSLGSSATFLGFGVICVFSVLFVFCYIPETKGRSLEDISQELSKRKCCSCLGGSSVTEICDVTYSPASHIA
ncbi:solute carrier family 2, facilitated glucose transporter member 12-like [Apostichopus japonicus]|uniref:solute carrier family 2, facilitated glucose transporter member 12-like n=1 Tax=Stichopus japonicus TaxID=307972 RepID=UPI003AB3EAAC